MHLNLPEYFLNVKNFKMELNVIKPTEMLVIIEE